MDFKKIINNENVLMVGAGVVAFFGVRYLLRKRDEKNTTSAMMGGAQYNIGVENLHKIVPKRTYSAVSGDCGCGG